MLKVSFKKNKRFPTKKVWKNDKTRETFVVLKGVAKLPLFLQYSIPHGILDWMYTCKNVEAEVTMSRIYLTIKGKARRADGDTENPILGERIAECRAKINLYRFMWSLCDKIASYFENMLYGGYPQVEYVEHEKEDNLDRAIFKYKNLYESEQKHLRKLLEHESDTESSSQS